MRQGMRGDRCVRVPECRGLRAARSGLSGTACGEEWFCRHAGARSQQLRESVELRPAARLPISFGYIAYEKYKLVL